MNKSPKTISIALPQAEHAGMVASAIPSKLGPVRLVREIGRGGMGVVYLGHDELLDRAVAVKFLGGKIGTFNEREVEEFITGARAAARVKHAGLVAVCTGSA